MVGYFSSSVQWLWLGDLGWTPYTPDETKKLEAAFQCKNKVCKLNEKFQVNLDFLVQERIEDPTRQRNVKRLQSKPNSEPELALPVSKKPKPTPKPKSKGIHLFSSHSSQPLPFLRCR